MLGPSGFAAEGREWLAALDEAGLAPSLEGFQIGNVALPLEPHERSLVERCAARPRRRGVTFHHMLVPHWAPDPLATANVVATLFETEGLPPGWAASLNRADRVLVSSEWCRAAFARAGVAERRLVVIPPPFDATPFAPPPARARRAGAPWRWLSVFDWSLRKGWDVLLAAFARAFEADEAELVLKVAARPGRSRQAVAEFCAAELRRHARKQPPRVRVVDDVLDREQMARLYASADGFVLASRGEGWGRPLHEAMLMELPVVATRAGALGELLPDARYGWPVPSTTVPVGAAAAAETPCYAGLAWQEPDGEALAAALRDARARLDEARVRAQRGRAHVLALCEPSSIRARLAALLAAFDVSAAAAAPVG
jgi:glycosyltransferase involved in cell wall biosynthesis